MGALIRWGAPAAAVATVALAFVAGASPAACAVGLVLYVVGALGRARLALIAAPLALAVGTPLPTLLTPDAAFLVAAAGIAFLPFFLATGAAVPNGVWRLPAVAAGALALLLFTPYATSFSVSDLAARTQVLTLAVAALVGRGYFAPGKHAASG